MKILSCVVFICIVTISAFGQKTTQLASPNGKIICTINANEKAIQYQIAFNKKVLIDFSQLTIQFTDVSPANRWTSKVTLRDTTERYELITGKASKVIAHYKEATITIQQKDAPHLRVNIVFRAFDDGIAFRYEFINQDKATSFQLIDENDEFRLTGNPVAKVLPLPGYTSSHEGLYTTAPINELPDKTLFDMPAVFQFSEEAFMAITEASLLDYAGMYLIKENNVLRSKLSPLPSEPSIKVRGKFPHMSPWRVMIIGKNPGDLIESNMLTSLSPPSRINDVSWIKPGKTTFPWWNGNVTPDTLNAPGNNFITQKYYIDF